MHAQAGCQADAAKSWQLRSVWAIATVGGRRAAGILSCLLQYSAGGPRPCLMSIGSERRIEMVRAWLSGGHAWVSWSLRRNRVRIGRTKFPIGVGFPVSPSIVPARLRPDGPCATRRRIDIAVTA